MDRMAGRAGDVVLGMLGAANLGAINVFAVAGKALIQSSFGRQLAKRDNCRLPAPGLDMGFSWTVTAFASGLVRFLGTES